MASMLRTEMPMGLQAASVRPSETHGPEGMLRVISEKAVLVLSLFLLLVLVLVSVLFVLSSLLVLLVFLLSPANGCPVWVRKGEICR